MQSFAGAVTTSVPACTCTRQQHALRHMDPNLTCSTRAHSTSRPSLASARLPRSQRNRGCTTAVAAAEAALSTNTAAAALERWLERKGVSLAAAQPQVNGTGAQAHSILAAARNIRSSEVATLGTFTSSTSMVGGMHVCHCTAFHKAASKMEMQCGILVSSS